MLLQQRPRSTYAGKDIEKNLSVFSNKGA